MVLRFVGGCWVWFVLFVGCYLLLLVLFGLVVDSVVLFFLLFRYVCFRFAAIVCYVVAYGFV